MANILVTLLYTHIPAEISVSIMLILICITLSPATILGNHFLFTSFHYKRNV